MIPDQPSKSHSAGDQQLPNRRHPIHGVHATIDFPTVVFLTVCTKDRQPWLANSKCHELLVQVWRDAGAWLVGRYVVMPDHLHLFATPGTPVLPLENWVRFWKSQFSKRHGIPDHRWQSDYWDRRLRREESYIEKWQYMRENPVRASLVKSADEWPYQGQIHELIW